MKIQMFDSSTKRTANWLSTQQRTEDHHLNTQAKQKQESNVLLKHINGTVVPTSTSTGTVVFQANEGTAVQGTNC